MTDLYDLLGVSKDADSSDVRRAYRRAAKSVHPDVGGSEEQFALLKTACDVLTDTSRRRRYDRTGSYEGTEPDNSRGMAMSLVSRAMDGALADICKQGRRPTEVDFVAAVRVKMAERTAEIKNQLSQNDAGSSVLTDLLGRCGSPDDVFSTLIRGKLDVIKQGSDQLMAELGLLKVAGELIKDQKLAREVVRQVLVLTDVFSNNFFYGSRIEGE
ncbi:MAG: J domain-containing protein [Elusimicrobia bacterium]|nr:J domain-containing protein [Elusimicrobiota bacterium]